MFLAVNTRMREEATNEQTSELLRSTGKNNNRISLSMKNVYGYVHCLCFFVNKGLHYVGQYRSFPAGNIKI